MAAVPPPSPGNHNPQTDPGESNWVSHVFSKIDSLSQFLITAAKEWLPSLLNQPTQPPFEHDASFADEIGRSMRLIVIVIIISTLLLGGMNLLTGSVDVTKTARYAFGIVIVGILIALFYKPIAFICGVRIYPTNVNPQDGTAQPKPLSVQQISFAVLYIFVPWLPIIAFIAASFSQTESIILQDLLLIAPLICLVYVMVNFAKAIRLITNCAWSRIWPSLILPLILFIIYDAL